MQGIMAEGCQCKRDHDSHISDTFEAEIVVFEPNQVLPVYRITISE